MAAKYLAKCGDDIVGVFLCRMPLSTLSLALSFNAYPKDGQEVTFKKTTQTSRKCELKTVFILY